MKIFILLGVFAVTLARECGENQHYETCGTACPLTCENYLNPPKACILMCNPGCHCDKGFVKTKDGSCVEPEQCPAKAVCGENEHYSNCGTACPLTCDNYQNPPKICPLMCVPGCHCEKGYVRSNTGKCVRPEECSSTARASSDKCSLPSETGLCRGYFPRYYYNKNTGKCERFIYGGCGGNENNFQTEEECQKSCGGLAPSACEEEKVTGPCKAYFPRFFYNKETGLCEHFIYGGCQGNSNNFLSQEDCEAVCKGSS